MEDLSTDDMRQTFQSMIDITLCAICLETVRSDMVQCLNGHLFCSECRGDLVECPTCRCFFVENKPPAMIMQMVEALPRRCRHKNCGRYIKKDDNHEKYCSFRPTQCHSELCNWTGPGQDLLHHVRQQHEDDVSIIEAESETVSLEDFEIDDDCRVLKLWSIHGQLFWHIIRNNPETKAFIHAFILVPNGQPKNKLFVKVSSSSKDMTFFVKIKLSLDPNASTKELNKTTNKTTRLLTKKTTKEKDFVSIPKFMFTHFVNNVFVFVCVWACVFVFVYVCVCVFVCFVYCVYFV